LAAAIAVLASSIACGGNKKDASEPDDVAEEGEGEGDEGGGGSDDGEQVSPEALDELNACFVKKRPSVARCYSEAVESGKLDKKAKGRVTVEMIITAGGKPKDVKVVQDTLKSDEVAGCVVRTIEGWVIPAPGVDTTFAFSYDFEPE
jgi:hypothetical protein